MPVRWYSRHVRPRCRRAAGAAADRPGRPPLWLRLDRDVPYPAAVRSVTLLFGAGRLWLDVTADLPVRPPTR